MATLSTVFYVLAGVIGLILLATHGSTALLVIGVVGFIVIARLHRAAAQVRLSRARRDRRRARVRAADAARARTSCRPAATLAWEPFVASIPVALLVALILYVNEIPDRRGDAPGRQADAAGALLARRRSSPATTSPSRRRTWSSSPASSAGILPIPVLLMLLTIPLALQVSRGLRAELRQPVRADGDHGRQRPAPPAGRAAPARRRT